MLALRWFVVLALLIAAPSYAQKFEPHVGQAGKDVIWVPTPDEVVDRMLTMAQLVPGDIHFDLGAGDGKIAIAAAKRGAVATGIEYNPDMAKFANEKAQQAGVHGVGPGKATIRQADIFVTDFSKATVITLYLLPTLNMKLRPQILSMKPGTRIVSHSFTMEDWEADEISTLDGRKAYFWMVPAQIGGSWSFDAGGQRNELVIEQTFQKISGWMNVSKTVQGGLRDARLRGSEIAFSFVDTSGNRRDFTGKIDGKKMDGTFRDAKGQEGRWSATRK
jgi:hypothetical protein